MADRKESAHLEARKAKGVRVQVVQFRGLAASLRIESSGVACDIKSDQLY